MLVNSITPVNVLHNLADLLTIPFPWHHRVLQELGELLLGAILGNRIMSSNRVHSVHHSMEEWQPNKKPNSMTPKHIMEIHTHLGTGIDRTPYPKPCVRQEAH